MKRSRSEDGDEASEPTTRSKEKGLASPEPLTTTSDESSLEQDLEKRITLELLPIEYTVASSKDDAWDVDHLKLPCSSRNQYRKSQALDTRLWKWELICRSIANPIESPDALIAAINQYQTKRSPMLALVRFFHTMSLENFTRFFASTLRTIVTLVLRTPEILEDPISILRVEGSDTVKLNREQCQCLVANMFLCTFPKQGRKSDVFGDQNFSRLFGAASTPVGAAKLECFFAYFDACGKFDQSEMVSFRLCSRPGDTAAEWSACNVELGPENPLQVFESGGIEEAAGPGVTEIDFANKLIGGGVLGNGAIQEEIRFAISPELLVAKMICPQLADEEALLMDGVLMFSRHQGYASSFRFVEPILKLVKCQLVAIDALYFGDARSDQYLESKVLRELNKCIAGFDMHEASTICSGNWGCGYFGGDIQLKALIQMLCAARAGKPLWYYTFGEDLSLATFWNAISGRTVGNLFKHMLQHCALLTKREEMEQDSEAEKDVDLEPIPKLFDYVLDQSE